MQQDQDAIGVREVALILLHALAIDGAPEFELQRWPGQFGQRQAVDFGKRGFQRIGAFGVFRRRAEHPDERAAGGADRLDDFAQGTAAVVFDDDTGGGGEVGPDVGVDTFRIANRKAEACFVEPAQPAPDFPPARRARSWE